MSVSMSLYSAIKRPLTHSLTISVCLSVCLSVCGPVTSVGLSVIAQLSTLKCLAIKDSDASAAALLTDQLLIDISQHCTALRSLLSTSLRVFLSLCLSVGVCLSVLVLVSYAEPRVH